MAQTKNHFEIIVSYEFRGKTHKPKDGVDALLSILAELAAMSKEDFDTLPYVLGKRKAWISSDPEGFHRAKLIRGTTWWIDSGMNTQRIMKSCYTAIEHFGLKKNELMFETRRLYRES